ncbi:MAG: sigma 54-interacting transcriptional regulator [Gammaproteobacteria bacterium]|nr:sigma 54-interacting transcriptional regulator [Gammaproteobacteria bacterium]
MFAQVDYIPLLNKIISNIDEGVLVSDTHGTVLFHNPALIRLVGLEEGTSISKIKDINTINLSRSILRAAIDAGEVDAAGKPSGDFINFELQLEHSDGNRSLEIISGIISDEQSDNKKRLTLIRDRTDSRHMEAVFKPAGTTLTTQDPRLLEIIQRLRQIAPTNAFVLLQGESGTGKTQLVRMIHTLSKRAQEPFIEVNCAAIPETLIESELFGHVKGAFTGASNSRQGRFQSADKGTLFLDEVSEIPMHLQAKLLRAIQDQKFEMVGSDKTVHVDVRIVAASNQNLRDMVDSGKFRADLFYRLAVIPITIPSLRERPGDIPLLSRHFCKQLVARGYPDNTKCNTESLSMMMNYSWPGNVRELENAIEHGLICAIDGHIMPESLPQDIQDYNRHQYTLQSEEIQIDNDQQAIEIQSALKLSNGNKAAAAQLLGINRSTLWRWMQKYAIEV